MLSIWPLIGEVFLNIQLWVKLSITKYYEEKYRNNIGILPVRKRNC